jgi:hypothetical protein
MSNDFMDVVVKILGAIGGIGIIIIGLFKFFGDVLRDQFKEEARADADMDVKLFEQKLRLAEQFAKVQAAIYDDLWKTLQALKRAGDVLWEKANQTNLKAFARQLRQTQTKVDEGAIYFDDQDFTQLKYLLDAFGRFEFGKIELTKIRANTPLMASDESIANQIQQNRTHKEEYEAILDRIRITFRNRLSRIEENEAA